MEDPQAHTATFGCIPVRGGTYQGQWRDSLRHGHGKMVYKDRRVYEGEWSRGRRHGFGTLTYPSVQPGAVKQYAGDWYENKREGFGLMLYHHKESYEGEWLADKREGWGRMAYRDGSYYEAHFTISANFPSVLLSNLT